MVTEPLAGATVTGNVAAAGCVVEVADAADADADVDLEEDPHAASTTNSSETAPAVVRLEVRRRGRAVVDRMLLWCSVTACSFTGCNFTGCSFTVASCRSRAAARRQWRCRSTCAFLACVVATDKPGDLARPPRRNDSCGNSAGFSPDFADLPVAGGNLSPGRLHRKTAVMPRAQDRLRRLSVGCAGHGHRDRGCIENAGWDHEVLAADHR
jgi:hypothetical protein